MAVHSLNKNAPIDSLANLGAGFGAAQAAQGLPGAPPSALLVAGDAEATIAGVARCFADAAGAREAGRAGAAWVRQHWRWERMYERCDAILAELGVRFPP